MKTASAQILSVCVCILSDVGLINSVCVCVWGGPSFFAYRGVVGNGLEPCCSPPLASIFGPKRGEKDGWWKERWTQKR